MTDTNQYLRLTIQGTSFLLPSSASVAIEQRDALTLDKKSSTVVAWRSGPQGRWPAYALDAQLSPNRRANWQRAVFFETGERGGVGVAVEEVQFLTRAEMHIVPFVPLGAPATAAGHLFNGAWVDGEAVALVIEPHAFASYLRGLESAA